MTFENKWEMAGVLGILQERTGSLKIPHGERVLSVIEWAQTLT